MFIKSLFYCCTNSRRERIDLGGFGDKIFLKLDLIVPYSFDWHAIGSSFVKDKEVLMEIFRDFIIERGVNGLEEVLGTLAADEVEDMETRIVSIRKLYGDFVFFTIFKVNHEEGETKAFELHTLLSCSLRMVAARSGATSHTYVFSFPVDF